MRGSRRSEERDNNRLEPARLDGPRIMSPWRAAQAEALDRRPTLVGIGETKMSSLFDQRTWIILASRIALFRRAHDLLLSPETDAPACAGHVRHRIGMHQQSDSRRV
jgi:hypothetical protein